MITPKEIPEIDYRPFVFTAGELHHANIDALKHSVPGLLTEGKDAILGGEYGIGKTSFGLQLAGALASQETMCSLYHISRPSRSDTLTLS